MQEARARPSTPDTSPDARGGSRNPGRGPAQGIAGANGNPGRATRRGRPSRRLFIARAAAGKLTSAVERAQKRSPSTRPLRPYRSRLICDVSTLAPSNSRNSGASRRVRISQRPLVAPSPGTEPVPHPAPPRRPSERAQSASPSPRSRASLHRSSDLTFIDRVPLSDLAAAASAKAGTAAAKASAADAIRSVRVLLITPPFRPPRAVEVPATRPAAVIPPTRRRGALPLGRIRDRRGQVPGAGGEPGGLERLLLKPGGFEGLRARSGRHATRRIFPCRHRLACQTVSSTGSGCPSVAVGAKGGEHEVPAIAQVVNLDLVVGEGRRARSGSRLRWRPGCRRGHRAHRYR